MKHILIGLFVLCCMMLSVEAIAQENSKQVWNGATPVDLQRIQAEEHITRQSGEISTLEQSIYLGDRMDEGFWRSGLIIGGLVLLLGLGTFFVVISRSNRTSDQIAAAKADLAKQIEDESNEMKQRHDQHVAFIMQEAGYSVRTLNEARSLDVSRQAFQLQERGTSPVGQPVQSFSVPAGMKVVPTQPTETTDGP